MLIAEIRKRMRKGDVILTTHVRERMNERDIERSDIENLIMHGVIIETYPNRKPCPAMLILGLI